MVEEKKTPTEETETGKEEMKEEIKEETKEEKKEEKPTLDTVSQQIKSMEGKFEKRLSDKDSHIGTLETENKVLRDKIQTVSSSLEGKTEKQKDAILEGQKKKFLEKGYDEDTVDLILETISTVADQKADKKISKVVTDSAMELIEADKDIDQKFVDVNEDAIMEEYNSYKLTEVSARKMKQNFKKAYGIVKGKLAEKAKTAQKPKSEEEREEMIEGNKPAGTGKKAPQTDKDFVDSIEKSGPANSHFV